jgi:hypothetical protein
MKMRAMMSCVVVMMGVLVCGAAVEVVESGSATIRSDQIDWNENASEASVNHLFVRRGEVGAARQLVLWRFDLSRCRGMSVRGDCMLSAGVSWAGMEAPFVLYEVSKPWQEASVTWSTLVGANGDHAEVLGAALATQPIGPVQGKPVVYSWRIPQATAQRWLDAPEKFHGVAVAAQQNYLAHHLLTRNCGNRSWAPRLTLALAQEEGLRQDEQRLSARVSAQGGVCETMSALIGARQPDANLNSSDPSVTRLLARWGRGHTTPEVIVWWFDVAKYKGKRVTADAHITCGLRWAEMEADFGLCEVRAPWKETEVTWDSLVAANGGLEQAVSAPFSVATVGAVRGVDSFYVWRLPREILQRWLDQPQENHGVALIAQGRTVNHNFPTRNDPVARLRPTLWAEFLDHAPETPANLAPVSFAEVSPDALVLEASAFVDKDEGDRHGASEWVLATEDTAAQMRWPISAHNGDIAKTVGVRVVWRQDTGGDELTRVCLSAAALAPGEYYWRVRYQDDGGRWGELSPPTAFVLCQAQAAPAIQENEVPAPAVAQPGRRRSRRMWTICITGCVLAGAVGAAILRIKR